MSTAHWVLLVVLSFAFGFLRVVVSDRRLWMRMIDDYRWHGRDNHPCDRVGCCR